MEIEKERIESLLKEIEKSHEQGLISDEAYSILRRDYEKKIAEPQSRKEREGNLEGKVFLTEGFNIETKRGIVEMGCCHFVPMNSGDTRIGGIFFGKGSYKIFHGDTEGTLDGISLILREGFSPEGKEDQSKEYLEKARKALEGVHLQCEKDAWWIRNMRKTGFGLLGGWSCEIFLSDKKAELRTPTKKLTWNENVELSEPTKEYQEKEGVIFFKTPTMTLELAPESLTIKRPAESVYLSCNELKLEKPAHMIIYRNWEEGIAPFRKKIRHDLEHALERLKRKEDLEKYRFLYEGEERGEREILVDKPASKFELGAEGLKVESPTSKVFVGKDGKVFIKTPTSHISIPGHGGKLDIDDIDETLRDFTHDHGLGNIGKELERAFRDVETKRQEIEEKIAEIHSIEIPPIPLTPPIHPLSFDGRYHRENGEEYFWKGVLDDPSFFIKCHETIEVVGHEGNEYRVKIGEDGEPDFRIEENKVFITAHEDMSMRVPKSSEITIENTGGDTEIKGISGNIAVHAFSGDIEIEDTVSETLKIEADSGDITLDNVSGKTAVIEAVSGSVEGEVGFMDCHIDLSSGDAKLDVHEGHYAIKAVCGDIEISLSQTYSLDATCDIGEIEVAGEERGQEYHFSHENPKIFLKLHVDRGDIEVE